MNFYGLKVSSSNLPFTTVLSLVVGLLLVFRTNTSYDRYWEGRRLWSGVMQASRVFGRTAWLELKAPEELKIQAIKDLCRFSHAMKNALRDERKDFLENSLGKWERKMSVSGERLYQEMMKHKEKKKVKDSDVNIEVELQHSESETVKPVLFRDDSHVTLSNYPTNMLTPTDLAYSKPLTVLMDLNDFIVKCRSEGTIEGAQIVLANQLITLSDALVGCQRIVRTPIPRAYSIHLNQILFLYCVTFPFSFVGNFGFLTIPIAFVVIFVFYGVKAIGREIENPFGTDYNDLPLERFCSNLESDLLEVISYQRK
jgi:putative membrane protein